MSNSSLVAAAYLLTVGTEWHLEAGIQAAGHSGELWHPSHQVQILASDPQHKGDVWIQLQANQNRGRALPLQRDF